MHATLARRHSACRSDHETLQGTTHPAKTTYMVIFTDCLAYWWGSSNVNAFRSNIICQVSMLSYLLTNYKYYGYATSLVWQSVSSRCRLSASLISGTCACWTNVQIWGYSRRNSLSYKPFKCCAILISSASSYYILTERRKYWLQDSDWWECYLD